MGESSLALLRAAGSDACADGCTGPISTQFAALTANVTKIHDLGKVSGFAKWIWQQTGEKESDDHDAVLLVAMHKLPASLPSFSALPSKAQQDIIRVLHRSCLGICI